MPTVSVKNHKKIGLFSAITIIIGSVIGVGIFFKNGNVFTINDGNPTAILIAWVIAGLISLFTAFSFAEVGSSVTSNSGLGGWCYMLVSKGFGKFVKIIQPLFYFGIITFAIAIFAGESIFNIFDAGEKVNFGIIMLIGFIVFILFIVFSYISTKASARIQWIFTLLKFIPLGMVILGGIIYGSMNPEMSLFSKMNENSPQKTISVTGILISLPSILFAFDSFCGVGNFSNDMKNSKRNVPIAVSVAMIIVAVFYILVSVGQIMVGQGSIYSMFNAILIDNKTAKITVHVIISVFILISILGVLNSMCIITIRSFESLVEENLIIYSSEIRRIANNLIPGEGSYKSGFFMSIISIFSMFIVLLIPCSILNTDAFIDGVSNFPTTFFFAIYATLILGGIINRFKKKVHVNKVWGFLVFAPIAVIGCFAFTGFQVIYTFGIATFINPYETMSWGLFSTNGFIVTNWMGTLFMLLYIAFAIIFYIINRKQIHNSHNTFNFSREVCNV